MNSDSVVSSFCSLRVHVMNHNEDFVGEPLYLAGSFNNWAQEHQLIGKVPALGQSLSFLLEEVPAGSLELKLSRGDWGTVAVSSTGEVVNLFEGEVSDGMNLSLRIDAWWDQFPVSTASAQVHVLDSYFFFPQLNRYRKVWIYLPLNYREGEQQYPVIYMHDGQHLFDQQTAKGRSGPVEWQVDETIDGSNQPCIVVAIDHADSWEQREQEYRVRQSIRVSGIRLALFTRCPIYAETFYRRKLPYDGGSKKHRDGRKLARRFSFGIRGIALP